jgi:hypothetical protein
MPSILKGAPSIVPPYPATVEKDEIDSNIANGNNASAPNDVESKEDEEVVYPGHLKFGLLFAALCVAVFQVVLVSTNCVDEVEKGI